ncbi:MAG: InlB B-repeat-containing protein [Bacilli bacterium]|nr:InlB B-repeat-containing protein [Bacilli bacterium]
MKKLSKLVLVLFLSIVFIPSVFASTKYRVKFNANKGTGTTKSVICIVNKKCNLTKNKFKKAGYTFVSWNTKKDGTGKSYKNKASVKNLIKKGTITLYAQWKKVSYKITYKLDGGKNNKNNPSKFAITTSTIKLKNPTKVGYTFNGWYSDKKYKNKITQIKKGTTKNIILYAKWTANNYYIKFDGNNQTSGSTQTKTCIYDKNCTLKGNGFKKTDYIFASWNTKKDGTGTTYTNKEKVKNLASKGTITLYAMWEENFNSTVDKINLNDNILVYHSGTYSPYCASKEYGYRFAINAKEVFKDVATINQSKSIPKVNWVSPIINSLDEASDEYKNEWSNYYKLFDKLKYNSSKEKSVLNNISKLKMPNGFNNYDYNFENHVFSYSASSISIYIPSYDDRKYIPVEELKIDFSKTPNYATYYGRTNNKFMKFANQFNKKIMSFISDLNSNFNDAYVLEVEGGCGSANTPFLLDEMICNNYNLYCDRW